jgi:hypothetical protein
LSAIRCGFVQHRESAKASANHLNRAGHTQII